MIHLHRVTFLLFFLGISCYSQQSPRVKVEKHIPILKVLKAFENQYQIAFSYDVENIKNTKLTIDQGSISIDELSALLKEQTSFVLQQIEAKSFIFIENTETIEICGTLIDAISFLKITEANVLKGQHIIKLTDNKGSFRVSLSPKDSISISHLGYKTTTMKASDFSGSKCDTIRLQPEVQHLDQVVIKEYLTTGIQKDTDASINVSTKKLKVLPGLVEPDVLQSLQLLPGVNSPTEDPAGLYIRGGTPDQNLVLWDGIKIYQTGHFFNQISTFNPYIVKDVKVYRGGTSVRYGDRVSGTIIINSDDDVTNEFKIGGGVNFTHADMYAKIPLSKKVGLLAAFRRSTTDLYQNINFNNISKKVFQNTRADIPDDNSDASREDKFSFHDSNFKAIWNPNERNNLQLSSIFSENILDNVSPIQEIRDASFLREEDFYKISNVGTSLRWKKTSLQHSVQKATIYFSSFETKYKIDRRAFNEEEKIDFNYIQNNDLKDIGASYTLDIPIASKQSLAVGYQYAYNETKYITDEFFTDGNQEVSFENKTTASNNHHTLYSEYTYKDSKINSHIGLRGSYFSRQHRFFIEPRLFSSVEVFKNFRITASAELKNQQITTYSDYGSVSPSIQGLPVADNVLILSGETKRDGEIFTIPVIKSKQFTLGVLYTSNGWNFDLEGYYKNLSDITSVSNPILEFVSITTDDNNIEKGKERRIGFDFLLKKRIHNYRFWLGYSLSKTFVTFSNLQENSFPSNFDQRHVFNISQTLKVKGFEFALGWNYSSARPFTQLLSDESGFGGLSLDPEGINARRFKAYHRLDASVLYRFNIKAQKPWGGMLGFSLRNIYNRKNIIGQGFREVGTEDILIDIFNRNSLRLTPDVVIRFNF